MRHWKYFHPHQTIKLQEWQKYMCSYSENIKSSHLEQNDQWQSYYPIYNLTWAQIKIMPALKIFSPSPKNQNSRMTRCMCSYNENLKSSHLEENDQRQQFHREFKKLCGMLVTTIPDGDGSGNRSRKSWTILFDIIK